MVPADRVRPIEILLIEDNPGDIRLVEEAFKQTQLSAQLRVTKSGEEALAYLTGEERADAGSPGLILLDLFLSGMDGIEVLRRIKTNGMTTAPVIVLTSSATEAHIRRSYAEYASAHVVKPTDHTGFVKLVRSLDAFWLQQAKLPREDA